MSNGWTVNDTPSLTLRLELPDHFWMTSTKEFSALIRLADELGRAAAETEVIRFVDELEFQNELRYRSLRASFARMKTPVEISDVKRGSWIIDALLRPESILLALAAIFGPTIKNAYKGSNLEERILTFIRDRLFRGEASRRAVEEKAADKPAIGNLTIVNIAQPTISDSPNPVILVELKRKKPPLVLRERFPDNPEELRQYLDHLLKPH